ncbi:hypothetical protein EOPP23_13720 [Endozoicomonas sp. OPT23]|uniref:helix-turn-helix domain-containing protein n=1 Tax=Endozoicomonas sp. OPT23 TaxID=2072845 RepID=UPI00129AF2DF|nr:helix-turn-helix domain-containing protein [Endozoicomonas sp. OPT23]MRI34050.1 hypothetical protein [Endozoicomonas sp. OPT23]
MNAQVPLTSAKEALIRSAERLIAERGIDAVSDREIAREAGQRNNSAVQYHFGDRAGLISAILDYRMVPLNEQRFSMMAELEERGEYDVSDLVSILVMPYINQLNELAGETAYFSLMSQLSLRGSDLMGGLDSARNSAILKLMDMIAINQPEIQRDELLERLGYMAKLVIHMASDWDKASRKDPQQWSSDYLELQAKGLISFMAGGMQQPGVR